MIDVAGLTRLPPVEPGPCRDCGGEPTRTLGRFPYCVDCADEIIAEVRGRILARDGRGVGVIYGHREPELGPHVWQLACSVCEATWSGRNGDSCPWCVDRLDALRAEQRARLRSPDLPDVDDFIRYDAVFDGWVERLAVAIESGLISRTEANAWVERQEAR